MLIYKITDLGSTGCLDGPGYILLLYQGGFYISSNEPNSFHMHIELALCSSGILRRLTYCT